MLIKHGDDGRVLKVLKIDEILSVDSKKVAKVFELETEEEVKKVKAKIKK